MIGQLASKATSFLSGIGSKAVGAVTGPRGSSFLASSAQFAMAHPTLTGAAVGGAGGFIGSMGDPGGALSGAMIGAGMGTFGISRYRSGHLSGKGLIGGLRKSAQYSSRQMGNRIRKAMPDVAQAVAPQKMMPFFGIKAKGVPMVPVGRPSARQGGKMLGALTVGTGLTLGAGVASGIGWNVVTEPIKSAGRTAKRQLNAHYGNAFSGMGNGTITGY